MTNLSTIHPPPAPPPINSLFISPHGEELIRGELHGLEHLEAHARQLAAACTLAAPTGPVQPLLRRFADNGQVLVRAYGEIAEATRRHEAITPDTEWLLDNFYIVEDVLREVRHDLPRGYLTQLPRLAHGFLAGYPRVYALALALVAHTDSSLDETHVLRFVQAYQTVAPLTIGELWAVPTMLRLALIENLRRLAEQMLRAREDRRHAEGWAATNLPVPTTEPTPSRNGTPPAFCAGPPPRLSGPFLIHLIEALRRHEPLVGIGIEWLERHLGEHGTNCAEVVRRESQRQASNQVTIGNCVTSLRLLTNLDWNVFFEKVSLVETLLGEDPAGAYKRQDFATRDSYRREVEKLSRGSTWLEPDVARRAVELARRGDTGSRRRGDTPRALPENHVGYYLVGRGRRELEQAIAYRPKPSDWLVRFLIDHADAVYFGPLAGLTGLILAAILAASWTAGARGMLLLVLMAALLPASELAVGLVNYFITLLLPPRTLPKLDFKKGIPSSCATMVVMPSLLLRKEGAAALLERLEIHYLANPDPELRFALLTDFADAPAEHMPEDESYLQAALDGVAALNARHAPNGPPRFFLFHRRRQWNALQGVWMGWERKRGKLAEFNRLLRGARDTSYLPPSGDLGQLPFIHYVITLDADTKLPRETAQRLVGTLAHPLNQPRFDPEKRRVVEGYGILQPRVSFTLTAAARSHFARVLTGSVGIDPYTTAVSDVYEDLFGTGSYTGKGIYDIDAFEAALDHAFPDNRILSHDLIEGNFARCGLVTDIQLLDDFPSAYHAYARREHRWARGDWQLLPWLFRKVPTAREPATANPLPLLERWKIIDNLRRSLVPVALIVLLVLGWTVLPGSPWWWNLFALVVLALPLLLQTVGFLRVFFASLAPLGVLREFRDNALATGGQVFLSLVFLLDQARLMVDAIVRTLLRLFVTRRNLLEWETAATTERRLGRELTHFCQSMWPAAAAAAALAVPVVSLGGPAVLAALPFVGLWLLSPLVAYWVSRPLAAAEPPLTPTQRHELRRIARKTWNFFETFVGDGDHALPPDNYQENPKGDLAHRTSPTNIGLYLLSTLAAHDLGFLGTRAMLRRLEKTLGTLDQLERHQGHFYNWYDTRALRSLQPPYVSTVDSGNLLGCLVTLKQGLREKVEEPLLGPATVLGMRDTHALAAQEVRPKEPHPGMETSSVFQVLRGDLDEWGRALENVPGDLLAWRDLLENLQRRASDLQTRVEELANEIREIPDVLECWIRRLADQVRELREEQAAVTPWLNLLAAPDDFSRPGDGPSEEARQRWLSLRDRLVAPVSLADLFSRRDEVLAELSALEKLWPLSEARPPFDALAAAVRDGTGPALLDQCQTLADRVAEWAREMDFRLLYNEQRHLFAVGFNLASGKLDTSHYDLLASEAALTSFLAVARGDVPRQHWFQLGRPITRVAGGLTMLSWGGTMFEYLMPRLLMRSLPGTLLESSQRAAIGRQIEYGRQRRVPWGISESAFNALDAALDYQYQSFGVPGLGLKRGLAEDLVIAPYATGLAVALRPRAALQNFARLAAEGGDGPYGFYEAIDYTPSRVPRGKRCAVVQNYMAHHQGMCLIALTNCLLGEPMPRRFHSDPMIRATELLLEERLPQTAPIVQAHGHENAALPLVKEPVYPMSRRLTTPHTPHPRTHLLSNGQYHVMVTSAGSGRSTCRDLDVTRWREDRTRDCWGLFVYLRDLRSGLVWSAGHQPIGRPADEYEVVYSSDKAEFRRADAGIETHMEITVSPENNAEVRRLTLTNHNPRTHELEVTSYAEMVLAAHGADLAHPAFAKLFIETEFEATADAILCRRRPRSAEQKPIWGVHVVAVDGRTVGGVQYETDRARFLGRNRAASHPAALERGAALSGTTGAVLDPILSLRRWVRVPPGASIHMAFSTAVADSREEALALADKYHDFHGIDRAFELAWAHSQVELRHLRMTPEEAHLYQRLAAFVLYASASLRAKPEVLAANRQGQPGLWRYGISGDKPIVLVQVQESDQLGLVRQLLAAHAFWRLRGLEVDLLILDEHASGYFEELHQQLQNLVRGSESVGLMDKPGGVFVRKADQVSEEDKLLLQAAARMVLSGNHGSLASQVDRLENVPMLPPRLKGTPRTGGGAGSKETRRPENQEGLLFANGLGGFSPDGREYVIRVGGQPAVAAPRPGVAASSVSLAPAAQVTPAPWVNVIATPSFGCLVHESGLGYTWAGNSQTNRLTPWNNDPVSDPPGEAVYLRDETTGVFWSPTAQPVAGAPLTTVRHGQGYTIFEQDRDELAQEMAVFVPRSAPVKVIRLKIRNRGDHPRQLAAAFYAEWVLGTVRDQAPMNVLTEIDSESGALLARNPFNPDFGTRLAFADVNLRPRTLTADRTEFLGRNGSPEAPAALGRVELSGQTGPTLDPCAALLAKFDLQAGEEKEIVFLLGQAADLDEMRRLLNTYRQPQRVAEELQTARAMWDGIANAVQVRTPNPGLDLMLNRWLLYQTLSCRVWGRSAFYQSGGAYGFRDQLQDVMALVYGAPEETRGQLLRAAARQFVEGDVQHWWHPPAGRGIRTRFSDDLLWLPFVACHYVLTTGDAAILDESIPFIEGPELKPEQEEDFGQPQVSKQVGTLYEHCVRAIERGLHFGTHGLPLMGTGDWNDGMNKVGAGGKGESVWDGWFLATILDRFASLAETRNDSGRAAKYRDQADRLLTAIEANAWDGQWYRRAYFDDGAPLGSAENDECQIDSIVQSWAAFCGRANPDRVQLAMTAVERRLVRRAEKLILLFTPPFDKGKREPGYIKGYLPGIRENGGQYTHAATWVVKAAALLGKGTLAVEWFDLLNPIHHATTPTDVARYRVEPYVIVGDAYSEAPHVGRGGWSWYTGSSAWLYRVGLESILGFHLRGQRLEWKPCIPAAWKQYEITYRHRSATFHIVVDNPNGVEQGVHSVTLDGHEQPGNAMELPDDGRTHEVRVLLG